jgi:ribosome-associated protein
MSQKRLDPEQSMDAESIEARLPITLGQFVKLAGFAATGGEAKQLVVEGRVRVNGTVETRRGHKLGAGDVVQVRDHAARVTVCAASSALSTVSMSRQG